MAALLATPGVNSKLSLSSSFVGKKLSYSAATTPPSSLSPPSQPFLIQALKKFQGTVVCNSSDKTVAVAVVQFRYFPKYHKSIRSTRRFQAHDPDNRCKVGDFVTLSKCAPLSKTKSFLVVEVKQGRTAADQMGEADVATLPPFESEAAVA